MDAHNTTRSSVYLPTVHPVISEQSICPFVVRSSLHSHTTKLPNTPILITVHPSIKLHPLRTSTNTNSNTDLRPGINNILYQKKTLKLIIHRFKDSPTNDPPIHRPTNRTYKIILQKLYRNNLLFHYVFKGIWRRAHLHNLRNGFIRLSTIRYEFRKINTKTQKNNCIT